MSTLEIIPSRQSFNLGRYAEEATIVTEAIKKPRPYFIEANTVAVTLEHLKSDCIIPVFAKDNEATISHPDFIETVQDAANEFFKGESIENADIRTSHEEVLFSNHYFSDTNFYLLSKYRSTEDKSCI